MNQIPKTSESKANVPAALAAPQRQATMTENANTKSEFEEAGPGPELDSAVQSNAQDEAPPMEIELGPAKEQSTVQDTNQLFATNAEPRNGNFENPNQEQPALRKSCIC